MLIVTSGARYIDIDAYASIIAYSKFLNLKGKNAILNDTKLDNTGGKVPHVFAQLTVWDASNIIDNINLVHEALSTFKEPWLMNLISLKDVKSFLISNDDTLNQT